MMTLVSMKMSSRKEGVTNRGGGNDYKTISAVVLWSMNFCNFDT